MDTSKFLELVVAGEAAEAKETLNSLLSAKAFEQLDARKVELAKSVFNGVEENTTEEE